MAGASGGIEGRPTELHWPPMAQDRADNLRVDDCATLEATDCSEFRGQPRVPGERSLSLPLRKADALARTLEALDTLIGG